VCTAALGVSPSCAASRGTALTTDDDTTAALQREKQSLDRQMQRARRRSR